MPRPVNSPPVVVVAVDAELGQLRVGQRLEVHAREVAEAQDEVDVALEQALERDVGRLVGQDEGAQAQIGMPQRGNQRSSSGSIGSSAPIWRLQPQLALVVALLLAARRARTGRSAPRL